MINSMNGRMVRAENPLTEGLGEGAIRGPYGQHRQRSPDSKVGGAVRLQSGPGTVEGQLRAVKTNGSITNMPRTPWPRTQRLAGVRTPQDVSFSETTFPRCRPNTKTLQLASCAKGLRLLSKFSCSSITK